MKSLADLKDLIAHGEKCYRNYAAAQTAYLVIEQTGAKDIPMSMAGIVVTLPVKTALDILKNECDKRYSEYDQTMVDLGIEEREPYYFD